MHARGWVQFWTFPVVASTDVIRTKPVEVYIRDRMVRVRTREASGCRAHGRHRSCLWMLLWAAAAFHVRLGLSRYGGRFHILV
jgi:hypothetical protein